MTHWLLLSLVAVVPYSVDVVEVNHVADPQTGQIRLEQVIWWDWCPQCHRYEVRDWRMLAQAGYPVKIDGGWQNKWYDNRRQIAVVARLRRDTWTWYDVEIEDRSRWPEDRRRKIGR